MTRRAVLLGLGLSRIIVESSLVFLRGPITAQAFTWHLFGIAGLGPQSAVALALTYTFFCDANTFGLRHHRTRPHPPARHRR